MHNDDIPSDLVDFADQLADAARSVIVGYFRTSFDVIEKADESPVTIADREAEAANDRFGRHLPWGYDPNCPPSRRGYSTDERITHGRCVEAGENVTNSSLFADMLII